MADRRSIDDNSSRERGREDRGGRDDRGSDRRGREDSGRDRDRGRESDRGSSRRSESDDGGRRRGGGSSYQYQERSAESVMKRAADDSKFDKLLKPGIKNFVPHDGDNNIRLLPPTWKGADHYGVDAFVHYGVGPDRQSYLDLDKMRNEADPISEAWAKFKRSMDPEDKRDQEYERELRSTHRCLVYLIDRDNEKEGVQAWFMPHGLDQDIVKISVDKRTGEVLPIDHPEKGYDISFEKNGKLRNTKYEAAAIARRDSPLGKDEWLEFAVDNPLPDQLVYFEYDYIAKAFGGGGERTAADERSSRESDRGGSDRGSDRNERQRDGDRSERRREPEPADELTWDDIHNMKPRELDDLVDTKKLKIDPKEAKDDEDLADWICEEMGIKKVEASTRRRAEPEDDPDSKLAALRERRRD